MISILAMESGSSRKLMTAVVLTMMMSATDLAPASSSPERKSTATPGASAIAPVAALPRVAVYDCRGGVAFMLERRARDTLLIALKGRTYTLTPAAQPLAGTYSDGELTLRDERGRLNLTLRGTAVASHCRARP